MSKRMKIQDRIEQWKKLKLPTATEIERLPIEVLKKLILECNRFLELSNKTLVSTAGVQKNPNPSNTPNNIYGNNYATNLSRGRSTEYNPDPYEIDPNITVPNTIPNISGGYNQVVKPLDIMNKSSTNSTDNLPYQSIPTSKPNSLPDDFSSYNTSNIEALKEEEGLEEKELEKLLRDVMSREDK